MSFLFGRTRASRPPYPAPTPAAGDAKNFKPHSTSFVKKTEAAGEEVESMIDMVFAMDCTGSMSSYIESAKKSIGNIVDKVSEAEKADIRFGYVAYRDHPPQDPSFVTMCHDFMNNAGEMKQAIATFGASGGGDGPEAVTAALHEALNYPWRDNAVKIVVLIADAPPHGVSSCHDGFPNGDPDGKDPVGIAKQMAMKGIILYVVACEPSLSGYSNAHDLMEGMAQITEGKYLPLTAADLLPDVIVGGAREEVALQKLEEYIQVSVDKMEKEKMSKEEIEEKLKVTLAQRKVESNQVSITDIYGGYQRDNIMKVASASTWAEAKAQMTELQQPSMQLQQQQVSFGASAAPASKMLNRCYKKRGIFS